MSKVLIPTILRRYVDGRAYLDVPGKTLGEVLAGIWTTYPALAAEVFDSGGKAKPYMAIFLNDKPIEDIQEQVCTNEHDEVYIIPAIAGGS